MFNLFKRVIDTYGIKMRQAPYPDDRDVVITCLKYGFYFLFSCQLLAIIYINLFQNGLHLGYDAAPYFYLARETWYQPSLTRVGQFSITNLNLDTAMPFASILYGLTGNILISYGIVNIIISLLIAFLFVWILKDITNNNLVIAVSLCFLFSPYVPLWFNNANPLDDFYSLLYASAAFWGFRILTGLSCIKLFLILSSEKKINKLSIMLYVATLLMVLLCSISSGIYILIVFIAPIVLFVVVKYIVGTTKLLVFLKDRSVLMLCLLVIMTFLGHFVRGMLFDVEVRDNPLILGADRFFENLRLLYLGFLNLLNGMQFHTYIQVISFYGVIVLLHFVVANSLLVGVFVSVKYSLRNRSTAPKALYLFLSVILTNVAVFIITCNNHHPGVFEVRYLIPLTTAIFVVFCLFLSLLYRLSLKACKTVLIIILLFLSVSNYSSFSRYTKTTIEDQVALAKTLSVYDAGVVYTSDAIVSMNLRVFTGDVEFFTVHFMDDVFIGRHHAYDQFISHGEYQGETLLVMSETEFYLLPRDLQDSYILMEFSGFRDWYIYWGSGNYFYLHTSN